jgi:hypothetical protein
VTAAANRALADKARAIAKRSEGLRVPANCVMVALIYSTSVKAAREALEQLEKPDLRRAAIALLDELTAEPATPVK